MGEEPNPSIQIEKHRHELAAFMVTYPSTYGIFEETVTDMTKMIHDAGGQVSPDACVLNHCRVKRSNRCIWMAQI